MTSFLARYLYRTDLTQHMKVFLQPKMIFSCEAGKSKHYDPKFKKERAKKVLKITLPDFDEKRRDRNLTMEEMRAKLKEKGITPPRYWNEKPILISSSADVFDPYIPPEGDGKITIVTSPGVKQAYETFGKKGKSYMSLRKIRNIDYDFDIPTFAEKAQEIYIESQKALMEKDEDTLHGLVTEKCFPEVMDNVKNNTIRWKFIQSLEVPRAVHVRCEEMGAKNNMFAQITIRFHTQQTLAIYDRFGRLMHGSEETLKDVLEYIVFEKQITDENGSWRIHAKIIPNWAPPRDAVSRTYLKPDIEYPEPKVPSSEVSKIDNENSPTVAVV